MQVSKPKCMTNENNYIFIKACKTDVGPSSKSLNCIDVWYLSKQDSYASIKW